MASAAIFQLRAFRWVALALLFAVHSIPKVDADKSFVPNYPSVVPRRNRTHIARAELCFGTVVYSDHYCTRT